ncbi:hypothetical protein BST61_g7582 [Cercospora zeina]
MFRSVLHQILRRDSTLLSRFARDVRYEERLRSKGGPGRDKRWDWTESDLRELFLRYIQDVTKTIDLRLYVDALDEGGEQVARQLMALFKRCRADAAHRLNICVSCRPYPERISTYDYCIDVVNQNRQDIARFLEGYCSEWPDWSDPVSLETVKDEILSRASGVFQWVIIVVGRVVTFREETLESILASIISLPQDLDELYHDMFKTMREGNSKDKRTALRVFRWITFAIQPLTLVELRYAIAVDADSPLDFVDNCKRSPYWCGDDEMMLHRIRRLSCGVVRLHRNVVQFDHESVREYMLARGISSFEGNQGDHLTVDARGRSEAILSRVCFRYLAANDSRMYSWNLQGRRPTHGRYYAPTFYQKILSGAYLWRERRRRVYRLRHVLETHPDPPLEDYAREYCWDHASRAETEGQSLDYIFEITEWPSLKFFGGHQTLQHLAAYWGFLSIFERILTEIHKLNCSEKLLLDLDSDLDPRDHEGCTPLWHAACHGQWAIVKLLLESGRVHVDSGDLVSRTPFAMAVKNGREEIAKLLLETKQVDLNSRDNDGCTPLATAVVERQTNIVKLLLRRRDVDLNACNDRGETPFWNAARLGHGTIAKMLLEKSEVCIWTENESGRTPLWAAVESGRANIVRLLLASKVIDVNIKADSTYVHGGTLLELAAGFGHENIVLLLFETGELDTDVENISRSFARAVAGGHKRVIRLLLERGKVDIKQKVWVDSPINSYVTALDAAKWRSHVSIVRLIRGLQGHHMHKNEGQEPAQCKSDGLESAEGDSSSEEWQTCRESSTSSLISL